MTRTRSDVRPSTSTRTPPPLALTARQVTAWTALTDRIAELEDITGRPVPCRVGGVEDTTAALWLSPDPDHQEFAAACCLAACPALGPCRDYIARYPREAGVYGGRTELARVGARRRRVEARAARAESVTVPD